MSRNDWPTDRIRRTFLRFFEERGHKVVPSAPLVPFGDPTLLFTSAGMVQFKPYFEGRARPPAPRMASIQKCFRTSDIDDVGDGHHLTFFEMLGNFSVGDYFKGDVDKWEGVIPWAWELLTKELGLPAERLWAAVYLDDDEAFELWQKIGVPEDRIMRYGEEENYWLSGDVGPCGPCSEIYFDFGPTADCEECEKGTCHPQVDCRDGHGVARFLELWNLVFMTFYQHEDGSRKPLPQKNIDTGAGLERWAAVLQNRDRWEKGERLSVYDTDLFRPVVDKVAEISGREYGEVGQTDRAMRIVAEHARAAAFLIADGVMPSNEGRGYVLRRVVRRAVYHGEGIHSARAYLEPAGQVLVGLMSGQYNELDTHRHAISHFLGAEEERFRLTLTAGEEILDQIIQSLKGGESRIPAEQLFRLYDTYGLPVELTRELAAERGVEVDLHGFQAEMEAQRQRARAAAKFGPSSPEREKAYEALSQIDTRFVGYDTLTHESTVAAIIAGGEGVESAAEADEVELVLHETPFYPEGGGQVGDVGVIEGPQGLVEVDDTQTVAERLIVHRGRVVRGRIAVNDAVAARVDAAKRADTMRNHTATHLLHAALRQVLGTHVRQSGSLVAPDRLRFDFTHMEALKPDELVAVQRLVNEKVRADIPVHYEDKAYEEAIAGGALAFFGEKYAERVRVVEVCEAERRPEEKCFSMELCGGTHCQTTAQVGTFLIVGEESIGAGVRRIEALTGRAAEAHVERLSSLVAQTSDLVGLGRVTGDEQLATIPERVAALQEELRAQSKRLQALARRQARQEAERLAEGAHRVGKTAVVTQKLPASVDELREMGDELRRRLKSAFVFLAGESAGKPAFVAMATTDVAAVVNAGQVMREAAPLAGGSGGGRPDVAQGGGKDPSKVDAVLKRAAKLAEEKLKAAESGAT